MVNVRVIDGFGVGPVAGGAFAAAWLLGARTNIVVDPCDVTVVVAEDRTTTVLACSTTSIVVAEDRVVFVPCLEPGS